MLFPQTSPDWTDAANCSIPKRTCLIYIDVNRVSFINTHCILILFFVCFFKSDFRDCSRVQKFLQSLHDFFPTAFFFFFFWKCTGNFTRKYFYSQISTSFRFHPGQRLYFAAYSHFCFKDLLKAKGKWWWDNFQRSLPALNIPFFCENRLKTDEKLTGSSKIQLVWILDRRFICQIFLCEHSYCQDLLRKC